MPEEFVPAEPSPLAVVAISLPLLPSGLGLAAGAMLYVVVSELIPDARATTGLMVGLVAMMFLDTSLS